MNTELQRLEKEIITLKNQTAENIILMGQKFIEAKKLVPHGKWGNWLEEKIGFSQRTANQFMRIAQEYGSNSQAISNLEATKIYLLMELPFHIASKSVLYIVLEQRKTTYNGLYCSGGCLVV